ncbi:MAG: CubicO group peptidase (beta-lactamase class C family), partial [Marivirga sp.]
DNFTDFVLSREGFGPGYEWRYNSALPNLLLKCIDNMNGGNVREWAHENFYSKLGIEDYKWQSQPDGYPEGAARMYLRPRDMLKIGITYLNNGVWQDEQVIPESWVNECFKQKKSTSAGDYSYYFWLRTIGGVSYLSADGDGGNYINIFPEQNMVIVITQGNYSKWPFYVNQVNDLMGKYIIPAIQE